MNPKTVVNIDNNQDNNTIVHIEDNSPVIHTYSQEAIVHIRRVDLINITNTPYIKKITVLYTRYIKGIQIENNQDLEEVKFGHYGWIYYEDDYIISPTKYTSIRNCPVLKSIKIEDMGKLYSLDIKGNKIDIT